MDPDPLAFWQATTRAKRAIFLKTSTIEFLDSTGKERLICFAMTKRQTSGHYRVALTATNCYRDRALNWSQSILRLQRGPNSKLNLVNTVTLPMPKFRSTGF